jgi:hypothetical protein
MFNLFRKKKKIRVIKSRRLITLQKLEGMEDTFNIAMHFELEDFHSRVQTILNELYIYMMTGYMLMRTKNTKTITRYMIEYQTYCSIRYQYYLLTHTRELRHRQISSLLINFTFQISPIMRLYPKSLD